MTSIRNKQRPFRLLKYLYENTDEEHPISTTELVRIFVAEDAHAKRKTVKDDIDVLVGEGFDVVTVRGRNNSFFLGTRKFELPEVKLLVTCIQQSMSRRTINRYITSWTRSQMPSMKERRSVSSILTTMEKKRNASDTTGQNTA